MSTREQLRKGLSAGLSQAKAESAGERASRRGPRTDNQQRGRGGFISPTKQRPHRLSVDLTPDERALFKSTAIELGLPVTEMLRAAVWAIHHDEDLAAQITRIGREEQRGQLEWPTFDETGSVVE